MFRSFQHSCFILVIMEFNNGQSQTNIHTSASTHNHPNRRNILLWYAFRIIATENITFVENFNILFLWLNLICVKTVYPVVGGMFDCDHCFECQSKIQWMNEVTTVAFGRDKSFWERQTNCVSLQGACCELKLARDWGFHKNNDMKLSIGN